MANALSRAGIAVLRTDDRGVGGSGGKLLEATLEDLADDARAGLAFLASHPRIDSDALTLIGGSQGSEVATLAALGGTADFVVLLSPPGLPGRQHLIEQQVHLAALGGADPARLDKIEDLMTQIVDIALAHSALDSRTHSVDVKTRNVLEQLYLDLADQMPLAPSLRRQSKRQEARQRIDQLLSPIMLSEIRYDPGISLSRVTQPVLVVAGDLDQQVRPEINLPPIEEALKRAGVEVTVRRLPGLNHMLQPATTGLPDEYDEIEVSIAQEALDTISGWLTVQNAQREGQTGPGEPQ